MTADPLSLQLIDILNNGIIVLDQKMKIQVWNRWMEEYSGIPKNKAIDSYILKLFPYLEKRGFQWKINNVFNLGNYTFFSQDLYKHLFDFPAPRYLNSGFEFMQQSVTVAPLKNQTGKIEQVCITITDETDAVLMENRLVEANKNLKTASSTDYLTQIPNRRFFLERCDIELNRHKREKQNLVIAILDIDHFKTVNDNYGHLCGDKVLVDFAQIIISCLREYDMVGRYGGEEFCILLANSDIDIALIVMKRIQDALVKTIFTWEEHSIKITMSAGIVSTKDRLDLATDYLLNIADQELYKAKDAGRNRIMAAS